MLYFNVFHVTLQKEQLVLVRLPSAVLMATEALTNASLSADSADALGVEARVHSATIKSQEDICVPYLITRAGQTWGCRVSCLVWLTSMHRAAINTTRIHWTELNRGDKTKDTWAVWTSSLMRWTAWWQWSGWPITWATRSGLTPSSGQ